MNSDATVLEQLVKLHSAAWAWLLGSGDGDGLLATSWSLCDEPPDGYELGNE